MAADTLRCPNCGAYDVSCNGPTCTCNYCNTSFSLLSTIVDAPKAQAEKEPFMVCAACGTVYDEGEWAQCVEADVTPHRTQTTSSWAVRCRSFHCPSCGGAVCRECVSSRRWGGDTCKSCNSKIRKVDGAFVVRDKKEIPLLLRKYLK